ncbi:MAG: energy transducer TonB [Acidobacteriota bacterium]
MFETIIQGQGSDRDGRKKTVIVSFAIHTLVLGILVVIPLVYYQTIPGGWERISDVFAARLPDPVPPSPPPAARPASGARVPRTGPVIVRVKELIEPTNVPVPPDTPELDVPISEILRSSSDGPATPIVPSSDSFGGGITRLLSRAGPNTPLPPPPKPPKQPMLISSLDPSRLIHRVDPVYPPLAIKARVQGSVLLQVTVNEMGIVESVEVMSGPTLLVNAAVEAVKQWRYKPTILNGEPMPVKATVTVNFNLRR